jgi:hypothetical protein
MEATKDEIALGASRSADAASMGVLAVEAIAAVCMWGPIPFAWLWIGGRVYALTGSLAADVAVVFLGFVASVVLTIKLLYRVDGTWVSLRRQAGHDQTEGALQEVVVISATLGLIGFFLWYYVFSDAAYVIPFMPNS